MHTYSHGNSHVGLGDSVHGRRDEGGLEGDALGDLGLELDGMSLEVDESRKDQEVIVGQTTLGDRVHQLLGGETIATVLGTALLELLESLGVIGVPGLDGHGDLKGLACLLEDGEFVLAEVLYTGRSEGSRRWGCGREGGGGRNQTIERRPKTKTRKTKRENPRKRTSEKTTSLYSPRGVQLHDCLSFFLLFVFFRFHKPLRTQHYKSRSTYSESTARTKLESRVIFLVATVPLLSLALLQKLADHTYTPLPIVIHCPACAQRANGLY